MTTTIPPTRAAPWSVPALQRLLADIEAGTVDIVVVYKIDRLTRSLTDFSRMIEVFERHGVSFVSVTQQFNTTCGSSLASWRIGWSGEPSWTWRA